MQDVIHSCLQRRPEARPSIPSLLAHAMLRPAAPAIPPAPAAGSVGLSVEQLGELIQQVAAAGDAISTDALLQQITMRQQGVANEPLDVRGLVSASLRREEPSAPVTPRATPVQPSPAHTNGLGASRAAALPTAPAPSLFATSRRGDMPGSATRTRLPAPPTTSFTSLAAPPAPPAPPAAPPPPAPLPVPGLARGDSKISAADLQQVLKGGLKKVASVDTATSGAPQRQNEWADDFLRQAMASRRQTGWRDEDTVDLTDAFK